jgi:hypothetical protein
MLRGVPLEVAHQFLASEAASSAYNEAQVAFTLARGPGTPLLPSAAAGGDRGPAPYLRQVITDMLSRYADGGAAAPVGDSELRIAAEAHLALVQTVAGRIVSAGVLPPDPLLPAAAEGFAFGMVQVDRPDWLGDAYIASLLRRESAPPSSSADVPDHLGQAHERLAAESQYWRGIPAHGGKDRAAAEGRATALGLVSASPEIDFPDAAIDYEPSPIAGPDGWVPDAAAQLGGRADALVALPPAPGRDSLEEAIMARFAAGAVATTEPQGTPGASVWEGSVASILTTLDVMRNYVYQPV